MPTPTTPGTIFARLAPATDPDAGSDYVSLADMVAIGVESGWRHFAIEGYAPDAAGTDQDPWGRIIPMKAAECGAPTPLTADTVRDGLASVIDDRLDRGWTEVEVLGTYLEDIDAEGADSILQHVVYGTDIYS